MKSALELFREVRAGESRVNGSCGSESIVSAECSAGIPNADNPLGGLTLDEFATSGRAVTIHSAVLGCDVMFVADNVDDALVANVTSPIYRARELRCLMDTPPDLLKLVHEARALFGGIITE